MTSHLFLGVSDRESWLLYTEVAQLGCCLQWHESWWHPCLVRRSPWWRTQKCIGNGIIMSSGLGNDHWCVANNFSLLSDRLTTPKLYSMKKMSRNIHVQKISWCINVSITVIGTFTCKLLIPIAMCCVICLRCACSARYTIVCLCVCVHCYSCSTINEKSGF